LISKLKKVKKNPLKMNLLILMKKVRGEKNPLKMNLLTLNLMKVVSLKKNLLKILKMK
jgi:hypothetical protein